MKLLKKSIDGRSNLLSLIDVRVLHDRWLHVFESLYQPVRAPPDRGGNDAASMDTVPFSLSSERGRQSEGGD